MRSAGINGADIGGDLDATQGDDIAGDDLGTGEGEASTLGSDNVTPPTTPTQEV
jgi:hypothetical protein